MAGSFYPAAAEACAGLVDRCLAAARVPALSPKALIAPHAGYVFSGPVAGSGYATLAPRRGTISRVVLLGPTHRMAIPGLAVHPADAWATPLGLLPVDRALRDRLAALPQVAVDPAPFAGEHGLEVHLPFIQRALGEVTILPLLVGGATPEQVAGVLQVAWGGPETAIIVSSDLSHYLEYAAAREKDIAAVQAIEMLRADRLGRDQACGRHAIYGLIGRARALDLRATCLDYRNSGDTRGGKDRVVGYASIAFEYAGEARLPPADRAMAMEMARAAVRFGVAHGRPPRAEFGAMSPTLAAMRAAFVTLTLDGALRGCVGSLAAHRPLREDILDQAYKAAFGDRRFAPLTAEEEARVKIDISVLSHARPLRAASEAELLAALNPDRDGLILRDQDRQAIFLPQVWESIPDPRLFVRQLKRKAGLPPEHWSDTLRAFRFTTESFGDSKGM
ncbi:MAG: AmmeMemoRadiSam system protein B [Thalassobaculales bacterium]